MKIFEDYRLRRALKRKAKRLRKAGRLIGITTDTDFDKILFCSGGARHTTEAF